MVSIDFSRFSKLNLSQPSHILWPTEYPVLSMTPAFLAQVSSWLSLCQESVAAMPPNKSPNTEYGSSSTGKGETPRLQSCIFTRRHIHIYWQTWVKLLLYSTVILKGWTLSCREFKKLSIWYNKGIKIWNIFIQNC